ncbi:site-specific integrase [Rhodococcus sp. D2-41]|uniref:Site-specific integrase n=1 Tax=Speluncibacter jeojiensis TaxID=2710754 RepID=A0A9X4M2X8_9ACTN|nr:site-specific integrase [Rhodococcus sp. D2-41]MDG3009360.1 site-specific integrase [Rhodococcus sp. D2-41]MDG3017085.1 site-specific integrase [Corynebacteriales bacterium D3-21]
MATTKPRRRPGNVRVEDRHYSDYKNRVRTTRWTTSKDGKPTPIGKRWIVRWVDLNGREKSLSFDKRSAADDCAAKITAEIHTGMYSDPHTAGARFEDIADGWLRSLSNKAPATRASHTSILNKHVRPSFGDRELSSITRSEIVDWVANLSGSGLSAATVRRAFVCLRGVLALAVGEHIRTDPSQGVKLPKLAEPRDRFLSNAEVAKLALELDPDNALMVLTLAYTGLRFGEFAALTVADVDTDRGVIDVRRSFSETHGYGPTKSGKSRRVPIPRSLRLTISKHLGGRATDAVAFTAPGGGPLRRANWAKRVLAPAAERAGLTPLTPHDLRHTYASLSAQAGVRVEVVSANMGHTDPGFTMRRYIGLFEDDLTASADLLDARMELVR